MTAVTEPPVAAEATPTVADRIRRWLGPLAVPLLTTLIAFLIGGLVVLITGHNPLTTYRAIFNGAGLNWIFPWVGGAERSTAAINLQQTLLVTAPLILTGLAVAFAFRAGLFNIGGQGQYTVGSIVAVWIGSTLSGMPGWLHIILAIVLAALAGALWAAIAGFLKAVTGAHEVISTIMLNWIAIWMGSYLFQLGGPLQTHAQGGSNPESNLVVSSAHLPVFWGNPELQGLTIGIFISLVIAVGFGLLLNRSTVGYETRAVGHNPDAAGAAGISIARTYVRTMALCGAFAGIAAALDVLGWEFQIATNDLTVSQVGFLGIAVALLGRNTALGTVAAALLFGALETGTSIRNLDPTVFDPNLAPNLTLIIEGLIVLMVSTDVIAVRLLGLPRGLLPRRRTPEGEGAL